MSVRVASKRVFDREEARDGVHFERTDWTRWYARGNEGVGSQTSWTFKGSGSESAGARGGRRLEQEREAGTARRLGAKGARLGGTVSNWMRESGSPKRHRNGRAQVLARRNPSVTHTCQGAVSPAHDMTHRVVVHRQGVSGRLNTHIRGGQGDIQPRQGQWPGEGPSILCHARHASTKIPSSLTTTENSVFR